jgi:hypothetical protein
MSWGHPLSMPYGWWLRIRELPLRLQESIAQTVDTTMNQD